MRCRAGLVVWRWRLDAIWGDVMKKFFGFVFRLVLLLAGLVFLTSLAMLMLLLLVVWLLRALWARLTGQAVSPWTFQVNRQAMMNRFYRTSAGQGGSPRRDDANVVDVEVVDVEVKQIKPPGL